MRIFAVQRVLGIFLMIFSLVMLLPILVSLIYNDNSLHAFVDTLIITLGAGFAIWLPVKNQRKDLRTRDGFLLVALFWSVLSLFGALPFLIVPQLNVSITDAVFESISGLTTTGATVFSGLDHMSPAILMYRQLLQWLGGAGVIVLAIAILPMLGVGGMQLYRAETAGPMKDEKITPRIIQTARALWGIYLSMTVLCALAYWAAGMTLFDAIAHSLTTLSTGGFSTHDASFGYFDSVTIELLAIFFMLIGAISFNVHFLVLRYRNPLYYLQDTQVATFLLIICLLILLAMAGLYSSGAFPDSLSSLRYATFQVVSVITSTGYGTSDFSIWPIFLPVLLIFTSFIGGCAGSTAGGIKVIRIMILAKEGSREIWRLLHPRIIRPIKVGGRTLPERVIDAVWGFFSLYVVVFVVMMLLMMATGVDQVTAFGAVASALNNLGPGLGEVGTSFAPLNDTATWLMSLAMLLGRLEIFTLLVLLTPAFWRR